MVESAEFFVMADFYGTRLATCSSDHKIIVFNLDEQNESWIPGASWIAHDSPVLRVCLSCSAFEG